MYACSHTCVYRTKTPETIKSSQCEEWFSELAGDKSLLYNLAVSVAAPIHSNDGISITSVMHGL